MARVVLIVALLVLASLGNRFAARCDAASPEDEFLRGYVAAVLEREFHVTAPSLSVEHGVVTLDALELGAADRGRVVRSLGRIRGVARVDLREVTVPARSTPATAAPGSPETPPPRVVQQFDTGPMPGGLLFRPLIADPRWPHFAAAYQRYLGDRDLGDVAAVSFGETFTIYRDRLGVGWWEVGVQAGVFAVFDLDAESKDLINADYLVGVPLTYRVGDFSALLRVYHQSSHVGDEFLLRQRLTNRVNLSYEAVDAKLSYEWHDMLRGYGGAGYLFDRDPSSLRPWSTQAGLEFRSPWPEPSAGWRPVAGIDVQLREENEWHPDLSVRAGVQLDGVLATRNVQFLLEYFSGHSPNGQFYRQKIEYLGLGTHFHF